MEIKGQLIKKLDFRSGQKKDGSGTWRSQDFVVRFFEGNYEKTACFTAAGERMTQALDLCEIGSVISVSFDVNSREWQGKWYTSLTAIAIRPDGL